MAYRLQRLEGIPVLIDARELAYEEDNAFTVWVHKARRLSSINALRASADKADVRLELKLRYRVKGQFRAMSNAIRCSCADDFESTSGFGRGPACSSHYWWKA